MKPPPNARVQRGRSSHSSFRSPRMRRPSGGSTFLFLLSSCALCSLVLLGSASAAGSRPGSVALPSVDPNVKPVSPATLRRVTRDMTLGEIFGVLGPARRSPCEVVSCWEWLCTDGRRLEISGESDAARKPDKFTILPSVPRGSCPGLEDARAEPVTYCDLVANPAAHDGQLVLTEAVWTQGFHSGVLLDRRCKGSALPTFANAAQTDEIVRKALWRILEGGAVARVDFIGKIRAEREGFIGPDGQSFRIEIECLLAARTLPLPAPE